MTDEPPLETPSICISGTFTFPCCGKVHKVTAERITQVACPICRNSYDISLEPRRPLPARYPRGTQLRLMKDVTVKVGSVMKELKTGSVFAAGSDSYEILGSDGSEILIEVVSPGLDSQKSILLASVPSNLLEEVTPAVVRDE